jgi:AGZA family xanthine/uracil permease-like MFS transporter
MTRYRWARAGDINAFFGLMLDNVAVMIVLFGLATSAEPIAKGQVYFTPSFLLTRMIPGTALGVLLGDLAFTALAFHLARRSGRADVTAMPLGLDTPSTFGITFLVLLPALNHGYDLYQNHERAMEFAWGVGVAVLVLSGVFKLLLAPAGNAVRRLVPRAGLLGSLAAIALTLIAFLPLVIDGVAAVPVVGLASLTIILVTLVAHRDLPGRFPGALAAVLVGAGLYWGLYGAGGWLGAPLVPPPEKAGAVASWHPSALLSLYGSGWSWWSGVLAFAVNKLPVALPFALATVVGGIDCTESAAAVGDEYDTRAVLGIEAVAALAAGLAGGVIQTTPYIGHPAYKKMGGRAAYVLATALFVGTVGYLGGFTLLFAWLPKPAMFPILVFVGLEITAQSFHATPTRHYPAVALAMLPALAYLVVIQLKSALGATNPQPGAVAAVQTLRCLANGFVITSMLWAAALATLLDGRLLRAAGYLMVAGVFAFFGVIHSPLADEQIGLPWHVLAQPQGAFAEAAKYQTPYHWTAAYLLEALLLAGLACFRPAGESDQQRV